MRAFAAIVVLFTLGGCANVEAPTDTCTIPDAPNGDWILLSASSEDHLLTIQNTSCGLTYKRSTPRFPVAYDYVAQEWENCFVLEGKDDDVTCVDDASDAVRELRWGRTAGAVRAAGISVVETDRPHGEPYLVAEGLWLDDGEAARGQRFADLVRDAFARDRSLFVTKD